MHHPRFQPHPSLPTLHRLPEIVRIEILGEFRINIDHMHVAFLRIADRRLVVVARLILLQRNTQRPVKP
jgi:hypothetical protein